MQKESQQHLTESWRQTFSTMAPQPWFLHYDASTSRVVAELL